MKGPTIRKRIESKLRLATQRESVKFQVANVQCSIDKRGDTITFGSLGARFATVGELVMHVYRYQA